jgi:hypothetical protein
VQGYEDEEYEGGRGGSLPVKFMEDVQRLNRMAPDEMAELGVKPPTVVVVGDQSHGKSSFVQKLVGCPYGFIPADRDKTTSCVLIIYTHRKRGRSGVWEFKFEEPRETDVIRNSSDVKRKITELEAINTDNGRLSFSAEPIVLHIYSSAIQHELAIVDTPGLTNEDPLAEEIATELIKKENTITVSARVPVMGRCPAGEYMHDQVMCVANLEP